MVRVDMDILRTEEKCKMSVLDTAKYFLHHAGEMTAMKLEKLVYYCQAWSLAWDGAPLLKRTSKLKLPPKWSFAKMDIEHQEWGLLATTVNACKRGLKAVCNGGILGLCQFDKSGFAKPIQCGEKFMTNREMMEIAMRQSAEDMGCREEDFKTNRNVVFPLKLGKNSRKYLKKPITCNFVSYGNNIAAASIPETLEIVSEYIGKFEFYHCFEAPNMHWLNERLFEKGHKICFMAEYYLPDISRIQVLSCAYKTRILEQEDFGDLYLPEWSNALCKDRKHLDVLGVGAYDGNILVGLAACSADCKDMWQIGVDVLPKYRRQGIASVLTSTLTKEIINRDKVPFYCTAWSNIRSVRNAIKSGFVPAWVEMTAKPTNIVDEMNL